MLYNVPKVRNGPELLAHKATPLTELNGLSQARRTKVFPTPRLIPSTIRLKDGRVIRGRGMGALPVRLNYKRPSNPYMSGLSNFITDAFGAISKTVTGTVSTISSTVGGVATAAQPIEKLLQENPSLVNLVKNYIPTAQNPTTPTVVYASQPASVTSGQSLGVSNKVWIAGAIGAGALAFLKIMRSR